MPDPFTIGATAVAAGFNALAAGAASSAARQAAYFQALIDENNAKLADFAAGGARARGTYQETIRRLRGGAREGSQTGAYAASGVSVQSGSALDVLGSTAAVTEMESQVISNTAAREAWGFETQGANLRLRAAIARQTGNAQGDAAILGGVGGTAQYGLPLLRIGGPDGGGGVPYDATSYKSGGDTFYAGYEG